MKVKIAVEMELDIPDVHTKKLEGCMDEFCEDVAKNIVYETSDAGAALGIKAKYVDHCWAGEYDVLFEDGMLLKG